MTEKHPNTDTTAAKGNGAAGPEEPTRPADVWTTSSGKGAASPLSPCHIAYLSARAVPLKVALSAGLRSVAAEEGAELLGFDRPLRSSGLAIPYRDENGAVVMWRVRLDDPSEDGPKFLTARGVEVRPYIPPASVLRIEILADSSATLCFAEGPIKALALCAHSLPALGLGGVTAGGHDKKAWGRDRRLVPHADLQRRLPLRNRRIVILFDAGRARNHMVALGEAMLAAALSSAGADAYAAALPAKADGSDVGPDDYLAEHGLDALSEVIAAAVPVDALRRVREVALRNDRRQRADAMATLLDEVPFLAAVHLGGQTLVDRVADEMKRAAGVGKRAVVEKLDGFRAALGAREGSTSDDSQKKPPERYRSEGGRLCVARVDRHSGEVITEPLANFDARIVEEIARDDGAEVIRRFRIAGTLADGTALPLADIAAAEFAGMGWVQRDWGSRAAPAAGLASRDRLREGIQLLSSPRQRRVYSHLGWRKLDSGLWVYLHAGGAIGAPDVQVDLNTPLDRFRLPDQVEDARGAVALSLELLRLGPPHIVVPIFASIYLAPVASILRVDMALWLYAQTGEWKSTLAAIAEAHFGSFDRLNLPGNWESTENALEARLFTAKDALFVIDDYAPRNHAHAQHELEKRAQRIIRAMGNLSGRGRMRADLSLRPDRPPRALLLSTGEDLPPGGSILARCYVVPVERRLLDRAAVARVQRDASRLPHALRAYVEWLAPQIERLRHELQAAWKEAREKAQRDGLGHLRMPEVVAHLYVGFDLGLQFAEHVGAVSPGDATRFRETGWSALIAGAVKQTERILEADPAVTFLNVLSTLLTQGRATLADRDASLAQAERPGCTPVGWKDREFAYLLPVAVRQVVGRALRDEGADLTCTARSLNEALVKRGAVIPEPRTGRPERVVRCGGERPRVLQTRLEALDVSVTAVTAPATEEETGTSSREREEEK